MDVLFVAACALIDTDSRVLMAQRPTGKKMEGLWEFPGGKVEVGERPEETVIRELREELNIDITEDCLAPFVFASHTYKDFHLLMPLFLCRKWSGIVAAQERQKAVWVKPKDMGRYDMPPANISLVAHLRDLL